MSEQEKKETMNRAAHDRENPYAQISKSMLHDKCISPKSKGVLCYLLSLPNNWIVHPRQVAESLGVGKDQIYWVIDELIREGYATKQTIKGEKGQFDWVKYEFYEFKILISVSGKPTGDLSGKPTGDLSGKPTGDLSGIPPLLKNNLIEKEKRKNDESFVPSLNEEKIRNLLKAYEVDDALMRKALKETPEIVQQALIAADQFCKKHNISNKIPTINKAIHAKWKPNLESEEIKTKNSDYLKTLQKFDRESRVNHTVEVTCDVGYYYIAFMWQNNSKRFQIEEPDFIQQVDATLKKYGFII